MKTDPIQDYILKNRHNLRIAAAISEAWPDAKEKLISTFLNRLEMRLKKQLKGWEFGLDRRFLVDAYPGYYFWKPRWERCSICLACYEYGEKMIFGVCLEKARNGKQPFSIELLEAMRQFQPSARSDAWWAARMTMTTPAADWRPPEVLWQMHKDAKFLESVAEQLLQVAKISEPILDRLERRK